MSTEAIFILCFFCLLGLMILDNMFTNWCNTKANKLKLELEKLKSEKDDE